MSAAAVQQLADVLQAVSIGALGTFLVSKFSEESCVGKFYHPSPLNHKAIFPFVSYK